MDQSKSKFGRYYSEVFKKTGVLAPAFGAALIFMALFIVRYIGLFANIKANSSIGYYLLLIFSLIGIVLFCVWIALKANSKELVKQDGFLLTLDFLMIYLLIGMIVFDFLTLDTVYYAVALIAVIVLNVLRMTYFDPEKTLESPKPAVPNTNLKKYFSLVFDKYGLWSILCGALGGFGVCYLIKCAFGLKNFFFGDLSVTIGILLAIALFAVVFVVCYIKRVYNKRLAFADGFLMFMLFTFVLCGLFLFSNFNALYLAVWLVACVLAFGLIYILALNTHDEDEETDADYFQTDGGKKFAKNPKVYFKQLIKKYDLILLGAITCFVFALFDACVALNVLAWAGGTKFMIYVVAAMIIYLVVGLIFFGTGLKNKKIVKQDGLLIILDVALLLLSITIFTNMNAEGMIASIIIWAIALVITLPFTIARWFRVRSDEPIEKVKEIDEPTEAGEPEQTSENTEVDK